MLNQDYPTKILRLGNKFHFVAKIGTQFKAWNQKKDVDPFQNQNGYMMSEDMNFDTEMENDNMALYYKMKEKKKLLRKKSFDKEERQKVKLLSKLDLEKNRQKKEKIKNIKYTHFLNIPIKNLNKMQKKIYAFKRIVLKIHDQYEPFFYEAHPHLTIAVMALSEEQESLIDSILPNLSDQIKEILKNVDKNINKKCFYFPLENVGTFPQNDTQEVSVVYGKIAQKNVIEAFNSITDLILRSLQNMGLIQIDDIPHVFLDELDGQYKVEQYHMTLMKRNKESKLKLNVQKIMDLYYNFNFGIFEFDKISLNRLDKFHTEAAAIKLI